MRLPYFFNIIFLNKNPKTENKSAFSIKTEINPYSLKYGAYKAYLTERINTI